jgi:hypothetical protein
LALCRVAEFGPSELLSAAVRFRLGASHRRLFSICQVPGDVPFKISAPHDFIFELAMVAVVVRKPSQFGAEMHLTAPEAVSFRRPFITGFLALIGFS